jgi:hypothetical protein
MSALRKGQRVVVSWLPEEPAIIVTAGEQVSEVRFPDKRTRFIPNEQLKPEEKESNR